MYPSRVLNAGSVPVALLALWFVPVQAQVAIRSGVDLTRATVGDHITMTITVDHDTSSVVTWPEPEAIGSFEVLEWRDPSVTHSAGRAASARQYVLAAFELGELEIPPIDMTIEFSSSGESEVITTQPLTVSIESVGLDESGDIRNIKPPLGLARSWAAVALVLLLGVGLAAIAWWAYQKWSQRHPQTGTEPIRPSRPAYEIAREALERLEASGLLERGELKRFFSEASDIIRVYLEGGFGIIAREMTSDDILRALAGTDVSLDVREQFRLFFSRCDLVKFAKYRPAPDACADLVPIALGLVEATEPKPTVGTDIERTAARAADTRRTA